MDFRYKIENQITSEDLELAREPKSNEIIAIRTDATSGVSIIANKEGWQYLAKAFIEMAYMGEKDPTFHIHRGPEFQIFTNSGSDEISLFNANDEFSEEVRSRREINK